MLYFYNVEQLHPTVVLKPKIMFVVISIIMYHSHDYVGVALCHFQC